MWIVLTLFTGLVGSYLFWKAKVPAGVLIGAIIFVAILSLFTNEAFLWPEMKIFAQILTGAHIGSMSDKSFLKRLPRLIKPAVILISTFFAINVALGVAIFYLTDLDLLTSLLCAMPGGATDTPLIALDMGADASIVASMQMVRMLFGICCLPYIIYKYDRMVDSSSPLLDNSSHATKKHESFSPFLTFLPTLLVATIAGLFGHMIGIPVGAMSAALIASLILKSSFDTTPMPLWMWRVAQLVIGCCIGMTIGIEQLLQLRQMVLPAILLCATYVICCLMMGRIMHKLFQIPLREAMLIFSPAGAAEMTMISADLGVHSTDLIFLQIFRLMGVVLVFPQIFSCIISYIL